MKGRCFCMKIKRLYIKNFQSIGEIELFFEENGCYHIRGEGNIGKSNIIKSIHALIRNIPSAHLKYYIKDGEETLFLEIEDFEHNIVRLSRGAEDFYSWYINGKEEIIEGTAGKVPQEVTEFFNMYEEFEKAKQVVNIRLPRAPYLFIDTTESENYYLLQKALNIEEYLGAIKLGERSKRETKDRLDTVRKDKVRVTEEKDALVDHTRFLDEIEIYRLTLDKNMEIYKEGMHILQLQDAIVAEEEFIQTSTLDYNAQEMKNLLTDYEQLSEMIALMTEIEELETFVSENTGIIALHNQSKELYDEYVTKKHQYDEIHSLYEIKSELDAAETAMTQKNEVLDAYKAYEVPQLVTSILDGMAIVADGEAIKTALNDLKTKEDERDAAESARSTFMRENNFCPVVMATKNRTCPFSNKTIEELIN